MEVFIKIAVLENEIEAGLLHSVLEDQNIPHIMHSYYDTAYDGLFQAQKGWGYVSAPAQYRDEIIRTVSDVRKSPDTGDPEKSH
jgi:hypothetical protein